MNIAARLLLLSALLGLTGCQPNIFRPERADPLPPAERNAPLGALLDWQVEALHLEVAQLRQRLERLREPLAGGCDAPRLRRAMLLEALPGEGERLHSLLRPCLDQARPDSLGLLGQSLWLRHQRLQNKEERHAQALSAAQQELNAAQTRVQELQRQLDGLKAIERSLQQRD